MEINKEKILKNINSIIAGVLIIICFLPMFRINAYELGYTNSLTASGFAALVGIQFTDGTVMGMSFFAFFLFAFPVVLVLSNYIDKLKKWKKHCIFVSPIGSIVSLVITKFQVASKINSSISTSVGFWLYLIFSIILLVLGYLQFKSISLNKDELKNFVEKSSERFTTASQEIFTNTCPKCGSKVQKGKNVCPKCGASILNKDK